MNIMKLKILNEKVLYQPQYQQIQNLQQSNMFLDCDR